MFCLIRFTLMFSSIFQTKFCIDFRQSNCGHYKCSNQTKFTPNTKRTITRKRRLVPRLTHPMRYPILHGWWHWITGLSTSRHDPFATHTIGLGSIMFTRVNDLCRSIWQLFHFNRIRNAINPIDINKTKPNKSIITFLIQFHEQAPLKFAHVEFS